jgi:excisionase family DNA binding protein
MKIEEKIILDDDTDRLLSIKEVAVRMRTSQAFIKALIDANLLQALKFRRNRRIRKVTLNKFLADHDGEDLYEVLTAAQSVA